MLCTRAKAKIATTFCGTIDRFLDLAPAWLRFPVLGGPAVPSMPDIMKAPSRMQLQQVTRKHDPKAMSIRTATPASHVRRGYRQVGEAQISGRPHGNACTARIFFHREAVFSNELGRRQCRVQAQMCILVHEVRQAPRRAKVAEFTAIRTYASEN
jgi:hypothetical protein